MNKTSPSRQKKEQIVAKLSDKLAKAKGLIFTNYQGLTHKQLEVLKNKLKAANAELVVTKNTLLKLSLEKVSKEKKVPNAFDAFKNPTATLFLYGDPIEPLKQLAQTIKQFNLPSIKFGILDKQVLSDAEVLRLATLPSREILLMLLLNQMQEPIYGLHRALGWNMQKFAMTLKAIESQNSKSQAPNSK